ncbi:MAG: hypothetical protein HC875_13045, partial [Anaerolineales bacterium]|nr:hypothetical protein [Anaerolineales bacterium]
MRKNNHLYKQQYPFKQPWQVIVLILSLVLLTLLACSLGGQSAAPAAQTPVAAVPMTEEGCR